MMVAHYHGQVWNASELARSFGVAHTTVQRYLDLLTETFMVRQLPSWHENVGKRQVKAPKVFVRDSGILHTLLGLRNAREIDTHPKVGASWEGFALDAVVARLRAEPEECFFWATHSGAELDLLVVRGGERVGFEFKRTTTPAATRSMHVAMDTLRLRNLWVVHAGERGFDLGPHMRATPLARLLQELSPLR
jgi:predicted AAA+ superfamily ATPase